MKLRQRAYNELMEITNALMIASHVIMSYTFLIIILKGHIIWFEPNKIILYVEAFFLVISWIGLFLRAHETLKKEGLLR